MRKTMCALVMAALVAGCTTRTDFGPCIGVADEKNPALVYKVSAWNVFLGIFFFGLIAPPIYVLVDSTLCPVAKKGAP